MADLNYPTNVQFCLNPSQKIFAIKVCRSCDSKSAPFARKSTKTKGTLSISNKNLHKCLSALIPNYNPDTRYKLSGEYDLEHHIMFFDIKGAVKCEYQPFKK